MVIINPDGDFYQENQNAVTETVLRPFLAHFRKVEYDRTHHRQLGRETMSDVIRITEFSAPELDVYARLRETQLLNCRAPERGIFIAESPRVIERALDAGCEPLSFLSEERYVQKEAKELLARCGDIPVYTAGMDVLVQITGYKLTRGMLCAMRRPEKTPVEEVLRGAGRVAVLEHVVNPTNVGAIFRSAAALNMDGVLLTPDCSDPLYRRSVRVSMGTVFQVPWAWLDGEDAWPDRGLRTLGRFGFRTAAMALTEDSAPIDNVRLRTEEKLAVILGTEGDGLAAGTIADCDYRVRIPMAHGVDSLNVAAASAVAFWELRKREREEL